jgi:type II secretory pathway component PulM
VAGASLDSLVGESASAGGFEIADGAMVGTDEFRFRLASVKAGALFNWLTALEAQRIELAQITLRKAEGGFVSADVRVRRKL